MINQKEIEKICIESEKNGIRDEEEIFNAFLLKYYRTIGKSKFFTNATDFYLDELNEIYMSDYNEEYIRIFYKLLNAFGYNKNNDFRDAIWYLSILPNPNKNKECIKRMLKLPFINDISYKNGTYVIEGKEKRISFELASHVFRNNATMKKYIENGSLPNRCHEHTYNISKYLPDFYAITSLCRRYFDKNYYHSYTLNPIENRIIDLCINAVLDRKTYEMIHEPINLSIIKNKNINEEIEKTSKEVEFKNWHKVLLIAMYKQYKKEQKEEKATQLVYK